MPLFRWGIGLAVTLLALAAALLWWPQRAGEAQLSGDVDAFLERHWRLPVLPQGDPPSAYSPIEASLHPKECALCHRQQFEDWKTSLHSRSMGPGIYGQLLNMERNNPATYTVCATCHTPLSEQIPHLKEGSEYRPNEAFDPALQEAGLICAGCHVRQHERFGPPRRPELPTPPAEVVQPHGGFTATTAFQRSEFCKPCHQFAEGAFALNGKLLENTFAEWQASPYAEEGVQCQGCHMPDRRHLWRGIQDPDMVRQAMTVSVSPLASAYRPGDALQATITVTNSGAGHYLPTYVTPKIFVQGDLLDTAGEVIADSFQEAVIGREIALNLSREVYDTRIAPKASLDFGYTMALPETAATLRVRIVVHPDHFYQRFFEAVLKRDRGSLGKAHLEAALEKTATSSFTVFEHHVPVPMAGN
jgi:hypothetical protein